MCVLVTNDDGIDSVGIQVLAAALAEAGHGVLVVAPSSEKSGTGAALGLFGPGDDLDAVQVALPEAPGVEAWALDGTPAMCVLTARLGGFGEPPEVVVSGINAGLNTGRAILHSGTVGAVLTGQNFGMSGLAISAQTADPWHWSTAAELAVEVLPLVLDGPPRSALNLNVPALPRHEVKGIRWARLAPFGEVRATMAGTDRPSADERAAEAADDTTAGATDGDGAPGPGGRRRSLRMELQLTEHDFDADSDNGLVRDGWAALTTLVGIVEAWPGEHLGDAVSATAIDEVLTPGAPLHPAHRLPDASGDAVLRRPLLGP